MYDSHIRIYLPYKSCSASLNTCHKVILVWLQKNDNKGQKKSKKLLTITDQNPKNF